MSLITRILLVDDTAAEWRLALSSLFQSGFMDQATVVRDKDEALDFLHARGSFRRRPAPSGLPAVVVIGPNVKGATALALLKDIRTHATLRRVPVVIIAAAPDPKLVRDAYEAGANSVVSSHEDAKVHAERYAALALYWASANEPPPGCLPQPRSEHRAP